MKSTYMAHWQKISSLFLSVMMALAFSTSSMAVEAPLKLRAEVDKAKASTTDEFTFSVTVDALPGVEFELPEIGAKIQGLRIVTFGSDGPIREEGRMVTKKWYRLQADISGSYVLPAVEVSYQQKPGTKAIAKTSEIFVEVTAPGETSKSAVAPKDILDIKAPIPYKRKFSPLLIAGMIVSLVLLLVASLYFFWWRKRKGPPLENMRILSPREQAIESLNELEQGSSLEKGDVKSYHFKLSEIIRYYVEGQFSFAATDMTFEEIKSGLSQSQKIKPEHKELLLQLLKETDVVKYTDTSFPTEKNLELLQQARSLVLDSSPAPFQGGSAVLATEESVI